MSTKICIKCGEEKPRTIEYFYICKGNKDGLLGECRECRKIWKREYDQKNKATIREQRKSYKEIHKERLAVEFQKYRKRNTERIAKRDALYRVRNKEKRTKYLNKWRKDNVELSRLHVNKRRAKIKSLNHDLTENQWLETKFYFNFECCYCGIECETPHQDHFIPVVKDGDYTKFNIVPACSTCNQSKNSSEAFEWYRKRTYYSEYREQMLIKFINGIKEVK